MDALATQNLKVSDWILLQAGMGTLSMELSIGFETSFSRQRWKPATGFRCLAAQDAWGRA
jgi:hypothetical protein